MTTLPSCSGALQASAGRGSVDRSCRGRHHGVVAEARARHLSLSHEPREEVAARLQVASGVAADDVAVRVDEEPRGKVPAHWFRTGRLLARAPHRVGRGAVRLHLGHQRAATAVDRQALARHEGRNVFARQLLAAELVARIEQNFQRRRVLLVPGRQLRVRAARCSSPTSDVHHYRDLAREARQRHSCAVVFRGLQPGGVEALRRFAGGVGAAHPEHALQRGVGWHGRRTSTK